MLSRCLRYEYLGDGDFATWYREICEKILFSMDFSRKGHRKGLKGDSDVTRENVHSKHRGAASSEVAESAAKESTFLPLFPSSPLPFPLLLRLPLGLLPALPRENRFFFLSAKRV